MKARGSGKGRDIVRLRDQKEFLMTASTTPLAQAFRATLTPAQQLVFDEVICKNDYTQETAVTLAETLECTPGYITVMASDIRSAFFVSSKMGSVDLPVVKALSPAMPVASTTGRQTLHANPKKLRPLLTKALKKVERVERAEMEATA